MVIESHSVVRYFILFSLSGKTSVFATPKAISFERFVSRICSAPSFSTSNGNSSSTNSAASVAAFTPFFPNTNILRLDFSDASTGGVLQLNGGNAALCRQQIQD
jgi:hypothetical protein